MKGGATFTSNQHGNRMATLYWQDVDGNWTNTANWSTGSAPATGDTVYILAGSQNIATNLNQSAVTLANLIIGMGFAGAIGTAAASLQIGATAWTIGQPTTGTSSGGVSGRIRIDFGSVSFNGTVLNTSSNSTDANLEPVRIAGTNAANVLNVLGGLVGVATTLPTLTSTIATLNAVRGVVNFGFGVTWTTANVSSGCTFNAQTGGTTLTTSNGAVANINGTAKVTTVNCGGAVNLNQRPGSGNIVDTLNVYETGTVDFSGNPGTGTIGTLNLYPGATRKTSPAVPNHVAIGTTNLVNCATLRAA